MAYDNWLDKLVGELVEVGVGDGVEFTGFLQPGTDPAVLVLTSVTKCVYPDVTEARAAGSDDRPGRRPDTESEHLAVALFVSAAKYVVPVPDPGATTPPVWLPEGEPGLYEEWLRRRG